MHGAKRHTVVNSPPAKVFNYLADFTRHHEWTGLPAVLRQRSRGTISVGATFRGSFTRQGTDEYGNTHHTIEVQETVTALASNRLVAFERKASGHFGTLTSTTLEIRPIDTGTRITMKTDEILPWWAWFFWLPFLPIWPLITVWVSWWGARRMLLRIKARLDSEVKRIQFTMYQKVSEMPGLSQTELFRIVQGERELKELAFRQLLDKKRLEYKGLWFRRYFSAERVREERQRIGVRKRKPQLRRKVLRKPGIAHTELLGSVNGNRHLSVKGNRDLKETAIRELLDEDEFKCEQKGRVRRYFPKRGS